MTLLQAFVLQPAGNLLDVADLKVLNMMNKEARVTKAKFGGQLAILLSLTLLGCGASVETETPTMTAGDAGPVADACAELAPCCGNTTGQLRTACVATVTSEVERYCEDRLQELNQLGVCDGTFDGSIPDAQAPAPICSELSACCETLPESSKPACRAVVVIGDAESCQDALDGLQVCS
mgnify:CR=1 FL=1